MHQSYLKIRHFSVALLAASVFTELDVPLAWEEMDKERILFDHCIEYILQLKNTEKYRKCLNYFCLPYGF